MRKLTIIILLSLFCGVNHSFSQEASSLSATCNTTDKNGHNYIGGVFEGVVHFGRHTLLSKGSDDIFIAKFSSKGECLWATRAGGKNSDHISSIAVDKQGNVYITGRFCNGAEFDERKFTTTATNEFFIAKYSPSGDLMSFVRSHGEKDADNTGLKLHVTLNNECIVSTSLSGASQIEGKAYKGNSVIKLSANLELIRSYSVTERVSDIVSDKSGNIIFVGDYTGSLTLGENTIENNGGADIFITKFNSSGKNVWLKQLGGDKNERAIALDVDPNGNVVLTGTFESTISIDNKSVESKGETDILIAKYSSAGDLLWMRSGGSKGYDNVNDICVQKNLIAITGEIDGDIAEFDKLSLGGLKHNLYVINYAPSGKVLSGIFGESNDPCEGVSLSFKKENIVSCIGNFEGVINFQKTPLSGQESGKSIFLADIGINGASNNIVKVGETDPAFEYDPNAVYTDVKGKLMFGKETKKPIVNQVVSLFEKSGSFIQSTITDVFGDFSFKNIDSKKSYNLDLGSNDSIPDGEPIYLAKQTGEVVSPIFRDSNGKFKLELLEPVVQTLTLIPEEDLVDDLKSFMKNKDELEKTFVENIYYETNSYLLLPEYKKELYDIIKAVRNNQSLTLEILSYTDSRGNETYNKELSEKRAKEVKDYLVSKGMQEENITYKGLGETDILNRCVNGVNNCSEKEHSLNRRTEFKFIKN